MNRKIIWNKRGDNFVAELSASECYSDILSSIEETVVQRKLMIIGMKQIK